MHIGNSIKLNATLKMKHILKIMALLVAVAGIWISLLETSVVPHSYTWLLPVYLVVSLGCYGLLMVGIGLMLFPTCPQEASLLQRLL
ncbi:Dolichol-phosphate mannosyltransferase subunit 3 (DPM3) [Musa troglodytarum]|uniref:Dolichol-phosphate mannosyltransferase subunit 3 n=1 Tax=Musa troglodytarum TaxID=320322 RepID=A0A9E7G8Q5_9LILI|nr:Dolichol-phosphate mannosyltransferase subunit 3 (DPM3) [Musa troglodytarum]